LPHVVWGDSDAVKVGDWVVAVGNPFGLGGTVTAGIVSARGRNIQAGPYDDFLQIDAPINRGNSGGPTFNIVGELIGINAAIYSPSGGSVGIGFAVPSNLAKNVVTQLKEKGRVTRGWLGVRIQDITPSLAKGLGLDPDNPRGALVADVTPGGPADRAGIKPGDVIVSLAGKPIDKAQTLPRRVAQAPVGEPIPVTVLRSGQEQMLQVSLEELREGQEAGTTGGPALPPRQASALGLQLDELTDEQRHRLRLRPDVQGVVVTDVAPNSPAASAVRRGDVIISVDQQSVATPAEAARRLLDAEARKDKPVLLQLNRRGESQFVAVPLVGSDRG
jgi:serine protease Do